MIKTEARRAVVKNTVQVPHDVRTALDEFNKTAHLPLDLVYNLDLNQWEIYGIKAKGVTADDDLLHWQMSAPTVGTAVTPGIIDWVRKYDTTNGGLLDEDELKTKWLSEFKIQRAKVEGDKKKKNDDDYYQARAPIIDKIATARVMVAPTRIVGSCANGPVYAVPRGSAQVMRVNRQKLANRKIKDQREIDRERFGI